MNILHLMYGIIEIPKPATKSLLIPHITPQLRLIEAGIDLIVDLHINCHIEAEFDLSPEGNQLRIYHSATGRQFYQAKIALQDGEPAIIVEPLTSGALRLLRRLESLSYLMGE